MYDTQNNFSYDALAAPDPGDAKLVAFFYPGALRNEARSIEEGRAIFDDVECVRIIIPGDKNSVIDRPATPDDKKRFAKQYAAFQQGKKEEDQQGGTPLTEWPFLSRAQIEELRYLGVRSVENLAELRDDINVAGLQQMKRHAAVWLGKTKSAAEAAKTAKLIEDQAAEVAALRRALKDQASRIEELSAKHKASADA